MNDKKYTDPISKGKMQKIQQKTTILCMKLVTKKVLPKYEAYFWQVTDIVFLCLWNFSVSRALAASSTTFEPIRARFNRS
jgi:hypothetical protein